MKSAPRPSTATQGADRAALVWIDSREAIVVFLHEGVTSVEHIGSGVPSHHRSTGHIRHEPAIRHGGGGAQDAGEARRLEHLRRFLEIVAARVSGVDDLLILGPGTVHDQLGHQIEALPGRPGGATRRLMRERSARATEHQLIRRLRDHVGEAGRRSTVGAYRWSGALARGASGRSLGVPTRITERPARRRT